MAIVRCPRCGEDISDKATDCVHCGYHADQLICEECGTSFSHSEGVCPNCGCPANIPAEPKRKKKHIGLIAAIVVIVIAVIGVVLYLKTQDNQNSDYRDAVQKVGEVMDKSGSAVDECSNLMLHVWNNAIRGQKDATTDKYVFPDGESVSDFNEALSNLYSDEGFSQKIELINESQRELRKLRRQLETPPKESAEVNSLLLETIDVYVDISMIVVNPSGSYNDISAELNGLYSEIIELSEQIQAYSN